MNKKGQSAMEYLMTYGWAILVIIIVIAVLFYIGVLNPRNLTPASCTFPPGISCGSYKLSSTGYLTMYIGQATGRRVNITGINCTQNQAVPATYTAVVIPISNGEQAQVCFGTSGNCTCVAQTGTTALSGNVGDSAKFKIYMTYIETDTLITRSAIGDMSARYES